MGEGEGVQVYRKVRYRWCMARWGGGDPGVQESEIPVVYGTLEGGIQVYRKVRYRWCMARWRGGPGVQEGEIPVVYGTLKGRGSRCTGR